jgi:putative transposase
MDWFSRRVLAWRRSIGMEAEFCVAALAEALDRYRQPDIFNTDQGAQFAGDDCVGVLQKHGIQISMDGRDRYLDNIFIERLWRSLKYQEVFIHAYITVADARAGIGRWVLFYNDDRPHQALGYQTPREIFEAAPVCGHVDNAGALTTCPQTPQQQAERDSIDQHKVAGRSIVPAHG